MIFYRSFQDNKLEKARPYQVSAFKTIEMDQANKLGGYCASPYLYDKDGYTFKLTKCHKFGHTFLLKRKDGSLSGILTKNDDIKVLSTREEIHTASVGSVGDYLSESDADIIAKYPNMKSHENYCVEYSGAVVEIKKGERVWLDSDGKIMIGWHGSYSPPHGM